MQPLTLLYRDDDVVVVDKPSGLVVHNGWAREPVVVQMLLRDQLDHWVQPVHRLDRGTSGALVFALNQASVAALTAAFEAGDVEKEYLALVRGHPPECGRIDHPIPRVEDGPRVPAVTDFVRLTTIPHAALVRAVPRSGRLHQIRRHFKHIGHPVLGDRKYARGWFIQHFAEVYGLDRLALHAHRIAFAHPRSRERVEVVAEPTCLAPLFERLGVDISAALGPGDGGPLAP